MKTTHVLNGATIKEKNMPHMEYTLSLSSLYENRIEISRGEHSFL